MIVIIIGLFIFGVTVFVIGFCCGISYVLARKEFRDIHDAI